MKTDVFLHEEAWRTTFAGWDIVDCGVRERDILYVALRKHIAPDDASRTWEHDIPSRLCGLYLGADKPGERWGHQGLEGFTLTRCGVARVPVGQGLAVSLNGDAFAMGSGKKAMEKVNPGGERVYLEKVRTIAGRPYAVGMFRDVYRRLDVGRWERLAEGLPPLEREELPADQKLDFGFRDIDGFAEDDLYAVGGKGDVWHFDGTEWSPCELYSNLPLFTVCCAGDGQVYISGEGGTLFAGRGDGWKQIWKSEYTVPYNDARWFDGKLWLASDYVLDCLEDGKVDHAHHEGERIHARGHMDVADGVLLIAGVDTVKLFDGKVLRDIVWPYP